MPRAKLNESDSTPLALRRLTIIGAAILALSLLTYVIPEASRMRPWVADEGIPVARMFEHSIASLTDDLGEAEMDLSNTDTSGATNTQPAPGTTPEQVPSAAAEPEQVRVTIAPEDYGGITQFVEQPEALSFFFAKLLRAARAEPGAIARIAHYGDSAVAADAIASTARRRFQARFGDAGHGFTLFAHGEMYYVHRDIENRSSGDWDIHSIIRGPLSPGLYGYGGVQNRGKPGATAMVGTSKDAGIGRTVSRFELSFQRYPGGGSIELKVDDRKYATLPTHSPQVTDAFEVIELPDGPHTLAIRAVGSAVRVYGVALERTEPGVVYDSLGVVGARAVRLLAIDGEHLRSQIARRSPDLLVLGYGGNESVNKYLNIPGYKQDLVRVLDHVRGGRREMSCMLLGPLDQGERNERGVVATLEILPKIVQAQREVAKEQGCAFYDVYSAMGGAGSMGEWFKARPKLAASDFRHATPAGYDLIGNLYYRAMLKAFAGYLASGESS